MAKKKWDELTPVQQRAIVITGALEVVVTAVALADLVQRPAANVRGSKLAWVASFVVQPFGPLTYLAVGRRKDA